MPQPTLSQLGAAIRGLREKRELSIEALASEADLHAVSVSRIEGGKQNPTWIALTNLANALEVEMIDLVRLAGEQPASSQAPSPNGRVRPNQGALTTSRGDS